MNDLLETVINTLAIGGLYALIALGYTLVYGILRFINFAHSDIVSWGAWIAFTIATAAGWLTSGSHSMFAVPFVFWCAMIGFVVYVHHTHTEVHWHDERGTKACPSSESLHAKFTACYRCTYRLCDDVRRRRALNRSHSRV